MGSDFNGDPASPQCAKCLNHPSFSSRNLVFPQDLTFATQHAVATGSVSQIHPNRHRFVRASRFHGSLLNLLATATLLHGRPPLHPEVVPGSYRIPSEPAFSFHLVESGSNEAVLVGARAGVKG